MPQLLVLTILTLIFVYWVTDYESSESEYGKLTVHHDEWVLRQITRVYKPKYSFSKKNQFGYLVVCVPKEYKNLINVSEPPFTQAFVEAPDANTAIKIVLASLLMSNV